MIVMMLLAIFGRVFLHRSPLSLSPILKFETFGKSIFDIIKDVDFIIYNEENLKKYLDNKDYINKKLNVTNISKEHIEYQCNKFKKHFNDLSDMKKIISRNITGIQISKGVLSTPRFIGDKTYSIPKDNNKREILKLEVIESINTSLIPRIAKVKLNNKIYELITPIWKYDSYLRDGDIIEVKGSRIEESKQIILYNYGDYIRFQ